MTNWLSAAGEWAGTSCDTSGDRADLGVGLRSPICYPEGIMKASVVDHVAPSDVCKSCLVLSTQEWEK